MAVLNLQASLRCFLLFWVVLNMALLHQGNSLKIHVTHPSLPLSSDKIPDEMNITLEGESDKPIYLHLKRVKHIVADVPVYTLSQDKDGKYTHHLEHVQSQETVAYYQDLDSEAAFELVITKSPANNGSKFVMKGELSIGGKKFILNPDTRSKREASSSTAAEDSEYNLVPQPTSEKPLHDYLPAPPEEKVTVETVEPSIPGVQPAANTTSPFNPRARRQANRNIVMDVVAVADYSAYSRFLASSKTKAAALQAMREYYAFIFNGVDMRYQGMKNTKYNINTRLVKLIIAETAATSQFTEKFRVSYKPRDRIDANDALYELSAFVAGSGRDLVLAYDHVMLFTGYDLTSKSSSGSVSEYTTGLAFTSTMCRTDGKSASIVEDVGGFQCIETATHEMGHSLSSPHDGDGNGCNSNDRFIMSSGGLPATESNKYNPWIFSSCSINYITKFLDSKLATPAGATCLTKQLAISTGVVDIGNRLPGQEFSPDDQCRMIYGSQSRMCRGEEFGTAEEICVSMFCFDPSTSGTCYKHKAASGTTCGNGKMCVNGKCVPDSRAPRVDDTCVFGDQPGDAFEQKTCSVFVNSYSGYCYQPVVRTRCCGSCQEKYTKVPGCEYGDTVRGCSPSVCKRASSSSLKQCCGTCSYRGARAATETRVMAETSQANPQTYTTAQQERTTPAPGTDTTCTDKLNPGLGTGNCFLVTRATYLCRFRQVKADCCSSCRDVGY